MARFIVRYRGKGAKPEDAARKLRQIDGVEVVEETRRMMLVEGTEEAVGFAFAGDDDWIVEPEQVYRLPDPRPRIKRPPQ